MTNTLKRSILVVGSLNADLVVRAPRFPQPGETLSGEDLRVIPGGKGANQAVAAARLGANVSMLGRVGNDNFGDLLLENLKTNRVDTKLIQRDEASTGTAIIVVDENGQNSIVLSPGANGNVSTVDVEHASAFHHDLLLLQLEIPTLTVLRAAHIAKADGARVILNPAPAQEIPDELIALADYIIPNETELNLLTGMEVKDFPTAVLAARGLKQRGAATVIVTMGANGALIVSDSLVAPIKTYPVKAEDTTAAGDAFIGGFATALLQNQSVEESVQYGCACGALATTKFGAQPSLPTRDEVTRFLNQFSNL